MKALYFIQFPDYIDHSNNNIEVRDYDGNKYTKDYTLHITKESIHYLRV